MKEKVSITINEKTLKEIDSLVNGISIRNRSQAIEFLAEKTLGENKPAVILAGGSEKKLKIFNGEYKPTVKIKDSTIVEIAIKKLRESGFRNIFIIAQRPILTRIFKIIGNGSNYGVKIEFIEEKETVGSADSLRLLKGQIKKSFLVVYCDVIFDQINVNELWKEHTRQKSIATLLIASTPNIKSDVGVVKMEGNRIVEFMEKPSKAESNVFFSGIFIAEPEIFEFSGCSLEKDVFPKLVKKDLLNGHLSSKEYLHIHNKEDLKLVENKIR
ncbi:MAG: hypothetical protein COY38_02205 [Candidatus Aenigmarchaeota archaeon CG_4_10_14_0_8_um_filter_37_24]|nr:nucleotidyltransferase family protein [Candidatus Aenigmarchaeota archaeon]NCS70860.1 nucleotidyltransferase family protein [Candidatus Aenigmarchaeota archaeon]PIZ35539.1 MAG: hypothetical protein COY38_02205 [Candidatus Aenigmarchaeota archaeon CG_4_10_14_0_8_um_filter_37_24]